MKLRAEILGVETDGCNLVVKTQVDEVAVADWRSRTPMTFRVTDIARNRNTFRVGRILSIAVEAK